MVIKIPREQKQQMLAVLCDDFEQRFGEPLGSLAAEEWLDTIIRELSPHIYNQAIADAQSVLMDRMASLEDELYALRQPIRTRMG
ncbi:DUF2164 domain-containing protein [Paenibacillus koleovorans]|uniref:DUF2164 domain-containing protein n=1 Tax=Paenibacillus koleovorans TaxID=121608 RepID=UPI0013E2A786|nr:DUF2164 domain-containing protein [Paenibacillus koleovorans]